MKMKIKINKFSVAKKVDRPVFKIMDQGGKWRKFLVESLEIAFKDTFLMRTMKLFMSHSM